MSSIPEAPVLDRLPEDVINIITTIPFATAPEYSLTSRDIYNLRATSKGLAKSLVPWYIKEFEKARVKKTGVAEVFMTAKDIRYFHASSRSWVIGNAIQSLHIHVGHFSMSPGTGTLLILHPPPAWSEVDKYITRNSIELLSQAFSNLPNLQEVHIGKVKMPRHMYNSTEYYKGNQTVHDVLLERSERQYDRRAGHIMRTEVAKSVLEALSLSSQRIKKLSIQSGLTGSTSEEAGIWSLDLREPILTKLTTCLQNLTTLHLTMLFETYEHPQTEDGHLQLLVRFLAAVPLLESFHLAASGGNVFSSDFIKTVRNALPTPLKELHLHNTMLTATVLHQLLDLHHRGLTELGLHRCFLIDGTWISIFRILDMYKPRLKQVYLDQIWDLRPEPHAKLFHGLPGWYQSDGRTRLLGRRFSRIGDTTCKLGAYIEGKQRRDFRKDVMTLEDGYVDVGNLNLKIHTVKFGSDNVFVGSKSILWWLWMEQRW